MRCIGIDVQAGASLQVLLGAYLGAGGSKGNGTVAGPFEIQTDEGIWSHPQGRSLLAWQRGAFSPSTRAVFRSWEALEADERAQAPGN